MHGVYNVTYSRSLILLVLFMPVYVGLAIQHLVCVCDVEYGHVLNIVVGII